MDSKLFNLNNINLNNNIFKTINKYNYKVIKI